MSGAVDASELYRRASAENDAGRFVRAQKLLAEAAAASPDDDLRARIMGSQAYALSQLGNNERAEVICRAALRLPAITPRTHAVVQGQLGTLLLRTGRLDLADSVLTAAIAGLEEDPAVQATLYMNRGVARMQRNRLAESTADLRVAAALHAATGRRLSEAHARHNLGYAAMLAGDLIAALEQMSAVRPVIAAASRATAAMCDLDRAEVLRAAGHIVEAERTFGEAAEVFGAEHMPQARADAELQLARSQLAHDEAMARRTARLAARRFRAAGSQAGAARADAVALRAELSGIRPGRAIAPLRARIDEALAALRRAGFTAEARALRFARDGALSRVGAPPARLPRLHDSDPLDVRLLAYEARAARSAAIGRDGDARRHAAAGLDELSAWQNAFGSLEMLSSVAMHGGGVLGEGIAAAVRSRAPEAVFEWSEHARHLSQQVSAVRPPRDGALAADLARLRLMRRELSDAEWSTDPRVAVLRRRVSERQWMATTGTPGPPRIGLDEVRGALDDETALLAFVSSRGALSCLVVPAAGTLPPVLIDLPGRRIEALRNGLRAELEVVAARRQGPFAHIVRSALHSRLEELSRLLVEQALVAAGDPRRVVITAPGELRGMPWTMLPALRARVVTLARSASRWVSERAAPLRVASAGFAVGPGVARGDEEVGIASEAWRAEAERLGGHPRGRVLRGAQATVAAVTSLAEEVDVLHVVAHGRHAPLAPMFSGFELADGTLFGYDVDRISRPPSVVVLSACELGRSSLRWGEEAIGMTRVWAHAGTRCVVAAPVTVADDVACELLGAMHEGLAARLDPAEALAVASAATGHVSPFLAYGNGF